MANNNNHVEMAIICAETIKTPKTSADNNDIQMRSPERNEDLIKPDLKALENNHVQLVISPETIKSRNQPSTAGNDVCNGSTQTDDPDSIKADLKALEKLKDKQEDRIEKIQASAFQLAGYYFVFQGVIFSAICNATALTCDDKWYVITVCVIAAAINLVALGIISRKYINAKKAIEETRSDCNNLTLRLSNRTIPPHNRRNDPCTQCVRYSIMVLCFFLLLAFMVVMVVGAQVITCNHDKRRSQIYHKDSDNCLRLCDGSNSCMNFCQTGLN